MNIWSKHECDFNKTTPMLPYTALVPSKHPHSAIDSDSEEDELNEFDNYTKSRRVKGLNNPLPWGKGQAPFSQICQLWRKIYMQYLQPVPVLNVSSVSLVTLCIVDAIV